MNTRLPFAVLALFLALAAPLAAQEGAGDFGLRLGQAFDPSIVMSSETDRSHFQYFLVHPPRISERYQHYAVYVTPFSKTIYTLSAWGRFRGPFECREEGARVTQELSAIYGRAVEDDLADGGPARFAVGTQVIVVECRGVANFTDLRITYTDSELEAEAKR